MKNYNVRLQESKNNCGLAAIGSVATFYGLSIPETHLRESSGISSKGTSILGLQQSARKLGLEAKVLSADLEDLASLPSLPVLPRDDTGFETQSVAGKLGYVVV